MNNYYEKRNLDKKIKKNKLIAIFVRLGGLFYIKNYIFVYCLIIK